MLIAAIMNTAIISNPIFTIVSFHQAILSFDSKQDDAKDTALVLLINVP